MIYLDNAATTLLKPPAVLQAMLEAFATCGNAGRGGHIASMSASDLLYSCRETAGALFGQRETEQIVFAQNTTHALNIAIFGLMYCGGHCLISGYEHNSVVRPLRALESRKVTYSVIRSPLFEPEEFLNQFEKSIRKDTRFAVCTHVSNVFGYILPIREIDEICAEHGISLVIDAAQSAGCIPLKLCDLKATVCICVPGHKGLYGPQGTGLLVCRDGAALRPLIYGGTGSVSKSTVQPDFMPDRHESGTQNIHGLAGLNAGMEYILGRGEDSVLKHELELIRYAAELLGTVDGIKLFSGDAQAGVLSFVSDRFSPEKIAEYLSENQVAVRGGLHCSPLAHETVGTLDGCVRISVSDFTSQTEIETLVRLLKRL